MTAVDVDALDAARAAATASGCDVAFEPDELADIIAEVRRGRALREAVAERARQLDGMGLHVFAERLRADFAAVDAS